MNLKYDCATFMGQCWDKKRKQGCQISGIYYTSEQIQIQGD